MSKIVNVSMQRNATQTISELLFSAGLRGIHHIATRGTSDNYSKLTLKEIQALIEKYENDYFHFSDAPYFMMYEYFDKRYPESKFILVKRDPQLWLNSFKKLYKLLPIDPISRACFEEYVPQIKNINDDELHKIPDSLLINMYNLHNAKIEKYFKNTNKLLVLNIEEVNNIEKISNFLKVKIENNEYSIDFLRNIVEKNSIGE